jgi:predicted small integral membrane protein
MVYKKILTGGLKMIGFIIGPVLFFMAIHLLLSLFLAFFQVIAGNNFVLEFLSFYTSGGLMFMCAILTFAFIIMMIITLDDESN